MTFPPYLRFNSYQCSLYQSAILIFILQLQLLSWWWRDLQRIPGDCQWVDSSHHASGELWDLGTFHPQGPRVFWVLVGVLRWDLRMGGRFCYSCTAHRLGQGSLQHHSQVWCQSALPCQDILCRPRCCRSVQYSIEINAIGGVFINASIYGYHTLLLKPTCFIFIIQLVIAVRVLK